VAANVVGVTDANDFNQGVIADYQAKAGPRVIPVLRLVRN